MTTTELHPDAPAAIAKATKAALRSAYPGVKFSLVGTRGTGYGYLHLSWIDGPTEAAVKDTVSGFAARTRGISTSRRYSPEAIELGQAEVAAHPGKWDVEYDYNDENYYAVRHYLAETAL